MDKKKHVLFYSNLCQFSQETLRTISKKNIRDMFVNICIDNPKFKTSIPNFVDRVPLILTTENEIVIDDNIEIFLNILTHGNARDELVPYSALEMSSNKLSDGFSYIDSNGSEEFGWSHNYVRLDAEMPMINPPENTTYDKNDRKQGMQLESLLHERDRDLDMIFSKQQRM